jgi:hypothetical protein
MTRKKLIKILREYLISSDEFFDCWLKSPTLATKTLEAQRDNAAEVLSPCEGDGARRSRKRGNPLTSRLRIAQQLLMRTANSALRVTISTHRRGRPKSEAINGRSGDGRGRQGWQRPLRVNERQRWAGRAGIDGEPRGHEDGPCEAETSRFPWPIRE